MPVNWKYRILRNWNFIRMMRLMLALTVITTASKSEEWLFLFIGGILLIQAVLNIGCTCYAGNCSIPVKDKSHEIESQLVTEEIKKIKL